MAVYYLDASAAVKGYASELGSERVLELLDPHADHELYLSRVGVVEVAAALFGRVRTGEVSIEEARGDAARLRADAGSAYRLVEVTPATSGRAVEVAERHLLRAYDCLQLATALLLRDQRSAQGLDPLILVSSDRRLNAAAEAEGLPVEDPAESGL